MASSPLEVLFTGAVVDVVASGDGHAPLQAVGVHAARDAATRCVVRACLWAEQRVWWMQDASEVMQRCSLHGDRQAAPHGWSGSHQMRTLRATSAHASQRGVSTRVIHRQRAGAGALRMTLEHECANVCRSVWCVVGRSCVTTSCTVLITGELCHELNFSWWVYITAILAQ